MHMGRKKCDLLNKSLFCFQQYVNEKETLFPGGVALTGGASPGPKLVQSINLSLFGLCLASSVRNFGLSDFGDIPVDRFGKMFCYPGKLDRSSFLVQDCIFFPLKMSRILNLGPKLIFACDTKIWDF